MTAQKCTNKCDARANLFCYYKPITFYGVVVTVAVAVVVAKASCSRNFGPMVTWCHTSPLYSVYLFSVKRKPQWTFRLFVESIVNKNILFRSFLQLNSEEMSVYQCCDIRNLPRQWLIFSWIFRTKSWKFPKLSHLLFSLNSEFSFYTGPRLLWLN